MSRILRRPMFRGGRVDGRGTGITSGLGYEKGGRVGLQFGGSPFGAPIPQGSALNPTSSSRIYSRPIGPPRGGLSSGSLGSRILSKAMKIPGIGKAIRPLFGGLGGGATLATGGAGLFGAGAGLGITGAQIADFVTRATDTPEAYAFRKEATRANPYLFDETSTDEFEEFSETLRDLDQGEKLGFFPRGGPEARLEEMGLTGKFDPSSGEKINEIIEEQITNDNKKKNYNNQFRKTNDTEESTEISKEDIEKNKELFAELLGGGKARGEDISNMLMSFAGKALKPEATVKGAFGEFFEEEAKRPSSKTKVDQAAAQLAINDYIAGKRSKEATESLLARLKTQAKLGAPNLYDNIVKIAGPGSNPTTSNLESALKVTEDTRGKPVTKIKKAFKDDGSKNYTIEEKDYDSFIITENPKTIIYIDVNGVEKQIY